MISALNSQLPLTLIPLHFKSVDLVIHVLIVHDYAQFALVNFSLFLAYLRQWRLEDIQKLLILLFLLLLVLFGFSLFVALGHMLLLLLQLLLHL